MEREGQVGRERGQVMGGGNGKLCVTKECNLFQLTVLLELLMLYLPFFFYGKGNTFIYVQCIYVYVCAIDIYRFPRSPMVTSLLYVVPEADAKQLVAAPTRERGNL